MTTRAVRMVTLAALSLAAITLLAACTIVPIEQVEQMQASEQFDPALFVDGIWAEQVVPTLVDNAQPLPTVLDAIDADLAQAGSQYAVESQSGALNFLVSGGGTVASVDTESRNGTAVVEVDGYDGPATIILQVGPLIRGDGIRDGVGFIQFGDFTDQTEFGQVSRELNSRVSEEIVGDLDLASLPGSAITFSGVITVRTTNQTDIDLSELVITPISLDVGG